MKITAELADKIKVPINNLQHDYAGLRRGRLKFIHCTSWMSGVHVNWVAQCDCGSLALLSPYSSAKSCGCLREENSKTIRAALNEQQVRDIRANKDKCVVLAMVYGVSHSTISSVRTGRRYAHVK